MIDLHSHILPAVDDGARNIGESFSIARAAAHNGTTVIAATPHVRFDYPTRPETIRSGVETLNELLVREHVPVRVVPGAEIAFDRLRELQVDELAAYGLGGNPHVLLVEFPYRGWPEDVYDQIGRLHGAGFTVVLAHPERNDVVQRDVARIDLAVGWGALIQVTAGSLVGEAGRQSRRTAEAFLARGLCHLLASDVHGPGVRRTHLGAARDYVGDERLARWLTEDVPGAILAGAELPERPSETRNRAGRRSLFGRRPTPR